nr:dihydropteroate synthase [Legionella adelaidensis]
MGILNVTPDSFSDGGRYLNACNAVEQAKKMIEAGADLIDIGGESSRPGALSVSIEEELARVIPVIKSIRKFSDIAISIDTIKPEVMQEALEAGASIINDINALQSPGAIRLAAQWDSPVVLMHMQGIPQFMQNAPHYEESIQVEISAFFKKRIEICINNGIKGPNLILDPGFGFGKTVNHNLGLIKNLNDFTGFNRPILIGVSRKSTIGTVLGKEVKDRLVGGLALTTYAILNGANIIRTHDVAETKETIEMITAVKKA